MASPPQVSPDGAYWWDGQAWQPTVLDSAPTSAAQPVQEAARPSWLPVGVELPSPSDAPDAPLTPAMVAAPDGSVFTPAVIRAPLFAVVTPAWARRSYASCTYLTKCTICILL